MNNQRRGRERRSWPERDSVKPDNDRVWRLREAAAGNWQEGAKVKGFDYGNSPSSVLGQDLTGKRIIHTTSAGTQGITNAAHADEIITGSLVNAKAIAAYIKQKNPEEVSLVVPVALN